MSNISVCYCIASLVPVEKCSGNRNSTVQITEEIHQYVYKCIHIPTHVGSIPSCTNFIFLISFGGARLCQVYLGGSILCDYMYNIGEHISVYINRHVDSQSDLTLKLNKFIWVLLGTTSSRCQDLIRRVLCLYYYPPCGFNGILTTPVSICPEECFYVQHECLEVWNGLETVLLEINLGFINCSSPGERLDYLPHCCVDAGITMDTSTSIPGHTLYSMWRKLSWKLCEVWNSVAIAEKLHLWYFHIG